MISFVFTQVSFLDTFYNNDPVRIKDIVCFYFGKGESHLYE